MTNKTTKICCTLALLVSVAATPAFSQAKNFEGLSVSLGANQSSGTTETTITSGLNTISYKNGDHNTIPFIDVAYTFPASKDWLFKVGARYDFSKTKSGYAKSDVTAAVDEVVIDSSGPTTNENGTVNEVIDLSYSFKNHNSLYLAPMYLVTDKTALFGKIGYHQIKGNLDYKVNYDFESDTDADANVDLSNVNDSASKRFKGWGYGIGLTTMLSNNLFVQVEGEYINYKSETATVDDISYKFKPENLSALVSIGYKF